MESKYNRLLAGYFSKELTALQEKKLLRWVDQHGDNLKTFEQARILWELSSQKMHMPTIDMKADWTILKNRMEEQALETIKAQRVKPLWQKNRWPSLQIAATVLLLIAASYLFYEIFNKDSMQVSLTTNEVQMIYLPDSSRVWLNTNTKLSYPTVASQAQRIVYLEGEAFFEVKRDESRPFIVVAANTQTIVLGTAFDVKAYPKQEQIEVIVAQGKVAFGSGNDSNPNQSVDRQVMLQPGDKGIFNRATFSMLKSKNGNAHFLAWRKQNNPVFKREKAKPSSFIAHHFSWKKNGLNQTVIEGNIKNTALLATYKNIKFTYTLSRKAGNKKTPSYYTVYKTLGPGQSISYKHSLLDILTSTETVTVAVDNALVVTP